MTTSSRADGPGLRERKKAKTRAAIQQHALRLFLERGYAETTVEQIAAAAEVSQSTFFRYFATKEDTVLFDQFDPPMIESFLSQPPDMKPLDAIRAAIAEVLGQLPTEATELEVGRMRLISTVPELQVAALDQFRSGLAVLTEMVAQRLGRDPDDFAVRIWSGAVLGAAFAAFLGSDGADFTESMDRAFALFDAGLPLD
jgi:AcrR family transcriptional regulator